MYTETCSKDGEEIEKSTPSPKSFQFQKETIGIKVPGNENSTQSVLEGIYNDINLYKLAICFYYNTCIV